MTTDNNDQGPRVLAFNPANEYYSDELCYINELSNSALDTEVSIARARVAPGITTRWHRLQGTTERYCILEGRAMVEVGDQEPQQLSPGDVVLIPPQCPQRITNTGDTDLVFLAICSPRFEQGCYQDIEAEMNT